MRVAMLTGGGDCPGLNAVMRAIARKGERVFGDELMTVCCDRNGCWGSVEFMRDSDEPPFDERHVELLHELAPILGTLLRRVSVQDDLLIARLPVGPAIRWLGVMAS